METQNTKSGTFEVYVEMEIAAPVKVVWDCFVDPQKASELFFNTTIQSDFKVGSPITWSGIWEGKPFVDHGTILVNDVHKRFSYRYWSSFFGVEDTEQNRQIITYTFSDLQHKTVVGIRQTNIPTEESKTHSEGNWKSMLEEVKKMATR